MFRGPRARWYAGGAHLALSVLVAGSAIIVAFALWYPGALFDSAGGRDLFFLTAAVEVTLGPLLTAIVFVPGKKGLAFDLVVIALLQISALGYGVWIVFEVRPVYIAFVKDRFELVRATDIPPEELERARDTPYARLPLTGPRYVAARLPTNPDERFRIMISGMAGVDVQSYPRFYVSYESARAEVVAASQPIAQLRALNPADGPRIDGIVAASGKQEGALAFLPMRAGRRDLTVVIDGRRGDVVRLAELRPWKYE